MKTICLSLLIVAGVASDASACDQFNCNHHFIGQQQIVPQYTEPVIVPRYGAPVQQLWVGPPVSRLVQSGTGVKVIMEPQVSTIERRPLNVPVFVGQPQYQFNNNERR